MLFVDAAAAAAGTDLYEFPCAKLPGPVGWNFPPIGYISTFNTKVNDIQGIDILVSSRSRLDKEIDC